MSREARIHAADCPAKGLGLGACICADPNGLVNVEFSKVEARAVMASLALLEGLVAVVQVQDFRTGCWETIAAFNVVLAADDYAAKCHAATRRAYRVMPTLLMPK